ncbi:helix-turn-helix domain-containing protein [Streptosporangium carneum]|uniref:Helix-turn-helix domain-containing protein n=1 Tax=Streptosporangium carneum TaxID=47481 RepID=A0A9W6HX81_9ACTN|nr:helix-turn-helix domain-containing protein [Streptosporangium carneum]GLK07253.1 hypothetical protein GCM10017600_06580 [Streptosporangium carneum]
MAVDDQIAYRPEQALKVFPIGRTLLFSLLKSGEIESFTVGRARFIPREALEEYMERLRAAARCGTAE